METTAAPTKLLEPLVTAWLGRLRAAARYKQENFGDFADEAVEFYAGPKDVGKFYRERMKGNRNGHTAELEHDLEAGFYTVTTKANELVQLYGPALYHRNPTRTVTVRQLPSLPRAMFVDPVLERQTQQIVQQLQGQMQQLQQQAQPQPGMPPNPQVGAMLQQLQMQLQQAQAPLQQAQQAYQQYLDDEQRQAVRRQAKAMLLQTVLNYTPHELDLKREFRLAQDEALVKGMGVLSTTLIDKAGLKLVGSVQISCDDVLLDPDVEKMTDMRWISIQRVERVADVARRFGVKPGRLYRYAGTHSFDSEAEVEAGDENLEESLNGVGKGDLLTYYEIYSRMGFGSRLNGLDDDVRDVLAELGDRVYLVLVPGMKEPLNLRTKHIEPLVEMLRKPEDEENAEFGDDEEPGGSEEREPRPVEIDTEAMGAALDRLQQRVMWPLSLAEDNAWPVEFLYFHENFNCVWPMAHLRPCLPQLKLINWANNHLSNRARESSRLIMGIAKQLEEEVSAKLMSGDPITVVPFSIANNEDLSKMWHMLQMPQGGAQELMQVLQLRMREFQDSSGLTELMYATMGGMRSAAEANIKEQAKNIRPDDMANTAEDFAGRLAAKEAMAWIELATRDDLVPILGEAGAAMWEQLFADETPQSIALQLDVRIESGSSRKPNKETQVEQMNQAGQIILPILAQVAMQGRPEPWNAFMRRWADVFEFENVQELLLPPPQPPQPPQPDPNIQAKLQADLQATQAKTQMQLQLGQQKMQHEERSAQLDQQMGMMELYQKQQELQLDRQKAELKLQGDQMQVQAKMAETIVDSRMAEDRHTQDMIQSAQKADQERALAERRAAAAEKESRAKEIGE